MLVKISNMSAILNWITDWWNSGNEVKCIVCGNDYVPAPYCDGSMGESKHDIGIVNICGESCFSRYITARSRKTKET